VITAPLLSTDACRVFFDGTFSTPRLDHPECVAVAADGAVWCGGEAGQIYRIDPDGRRIEEVARTGGFTLGLAFGPDGALYLCDAPSRAVLRHDPAGGGVEEFTAGPPGRAFTMPNYPVWDAEGRLYVSDSSPGDRPGPGVYRFDASGAGEVWHDGPFTQANGLALEPGGGALYVAETFAHLLTRIAIGADGRAGEREVVAVLDAMPDGLAFGPDGALYVGCYEPSAILRVTPGGEVAWLVHDETAHVLCRPTNLAFRGTTLFAANLGRWHVTALDLPDGLDAP
jgi:sugar lactone lactonase YvrE